jgi:hypothetical protein
MEIGGAVAIIGQVATWVTIILVYFTLREMRNQRKASQKPDIMIPKSSFHGYGFGIKSSVIQHLLIPENWSKEDVEDGENIDRDIWLESAPITLYNVGFGVAKSIKMTWRIQYNETLQQIKDYCYKYSVPIIIEQDERGFSFSEAGVQNEGFYTIVPEIVQHDFLMPASITSAGLVSYLPVTYRMVVSLLLYLRFRDGLKINTESGAIIHPPIALPPIELELHYDDVEDSHYSKKFDVLFTSYGSYFIEADVLGRKKMFTGSLEFKSKP